MQQKSVQDTAQMEMLADAKNLGQLEGVYRQNLFLAYLLGCSLLLLGGGLAGIHDMLFSHPNDVSLLARIINTILSTISILISLFFIYAVLHTCTDKILLYEHGVIIKRSHQLQAICWHEVQCVEPEFFYHSHYAWDFHYQLRMKNGKTINFRNRTLFKRIERKLKYQRS